MCRYLASVGALFEFQLSTGADGCVQNNQAVYMDKIMVPIMALMMVSPTHSRVSLLSVCKHAASGHPATLFIFCSARR